MEAISFFFFALLFSLRGEFSAAGDGVVPAVRVCMCVYVPTPDLEMFFYYSARRTGPSPMLAEHGEAPTAATPAERA